jgi:Na+/melibiose symporter-like transporter
MAFLAIPFPLMDPQQRNGLVSTQDGVRLATITASFVSTIFSIGSIATSQLHIRKHKMQKTAEQCQEFLTTEHHQLYGHRPLAILWSLPFAFFMWSLLTFFLSVVLLYVTTGSKAVKATSMFFSVVVLFSVCISVWYFWKRETLWTTGTDGENKPIFKLKFTNNFWKVQRRKSTRSKSMA